ncbi:MAG: UDP-N-acetylmuramate:L-alanyl-gamma-D-glutamyl-meso-diaminopimelate ligase [Deltaproteobacteria bacterium CG07_land_8_20_14_0_80_60_11]|nr:MAG: UDP-N-acetylmuramate:L-alanyl-gamma-D-glutamyl-meso-diaminopimelate ligase [Deltaproteobacteria bacterium CG07_land_8_20_14_0_80_60_11]
MLTDIQPSQILHIHLLGICGAGMAALAGILKEQGYRVTGSDEHVYPPMSTLLEGLGIALQNGYRPENLTPVPDLVVVGNVIRRENPEAQAVLAQNLPRLSLPEALNRFLVGDRQSIVVAGTHGKTTTTALIAWLLFALGLDPGFMVGGIAKNFQTNYRVGRGRYVVMEGDEYDTAFFDKRPKFVHFHPRAAVLTSIEFDHADIYPDLGVIIQAFETFLSTISPGGRVLAWGDAPLVRQVCGRKHAPVSFYGLNGDVAWQATGITPAPGGMNFTVLKKGARWGEFFLPMVGEHNVLNALAALAVLSEVGAEAPPLQKALTGFKGVKKRQEVAGEFDGVLVMEDFAHHPTAVAVTLAAVRQAYPKRRLVAAFEPRTNTSRRRIFQKPYAQAFNDADVILVREPPDLWKVAPEEQFSSRELVADLAAEGREALYFPDTDALLTGLLHTLRPGDVVLVMSNGDFNHLAPRLCEALRGAGRKPAAPA